MGKKHDMYIDYIRSNKRRGKRGNHKLKYLIWIVIAASIIGLLICFVIMPNINFCNSGDVKSNVLVDKNTSGINVKNPTGIPTVTILPTPLPTPTSVPTPTEIVDTAQTNSDGNNSSSTLSSVKGIYVPARTAGSSKIIKLIEMADTLEINAMVIDVKDDHGKISFNMDSAMAKKIGAVTDTISDIDSLIKSLKERDIYVIARIVAFKDPYLAEKQHDLAIKNQDGTLYVDNNGECWVNPYNREVWDYLVELATQAASVGFDEIQFDYIRFSTGKSIAKADFGEEAKTKSKEEIITEFTKYAYERIKPLGVNVSADVYGAIISSSIDAELVGQNYVEMSKYLDYICPMIYPSHFGEGNYGIQYPDLEPYNIIHKVLTASESKLSEIPEDEHHAIVRPWLQDFTASWIEHYMKYGGTELREQIEGVYSVGYAEWLLWNSGCEYSEDGLLEEQNLSNE